MKRSRQLTNPELILDPIGEMVLLDGSAGIVGALPMLQTLQEVQISDMPATKMVLQGLAKAEVEALVGHPGVHDDTVRGHLMLKEIQPLDGELQWWSAERQAHVIEALEEGEHLGVPNGLPIPIKANPGQDEKLSSDGVPPQKVEVIWSNRVRTQAGEQATHQDNPAEELPPAGSQGRPLQVHRGNTGIGEWDDGGCLPQSDQ